jgi:hypothetical protein
VPRRGAARRHFPFSPCVASDTDWEHAGITGATVTVMIVRDLIQRDPAGRLWPTKEGRAVLVALLAKDGWPR